MITATLDKDNVDIRIEHDQVSMCSYPPVVGVKIGRSKVAAVIEELKMVLEILESARPTKQVIVIRRDLKMRRGKEISQGSHSSMAFITKQLKEPKTIFGKWWRKFFPKKIKLTKSQQLWLNNSFAKVTVQVDSEDELLEIEQKAKEIGIECNLITDSGRTEFGGVPTKTCLALGPDYSDKIDLITGNLKLY